jgi:endothelin-converting enzyme/putative endopeptidase
LFSNQNSAFSSFSVSQQTFPITGADMQISRVMMMAAVLSATLAQPQSGQLRGVEVSDINRTADACSDFYEFANGKWRAENPIPAAMPRWSRRWAAGEAAKDRLHEILDQASALRDQPKGSIEQLIGDFYGACTDEGAINSLGVKPVTTLLGEIDQIRDVAAVQRMIGRFHAIGIRVPFQLMGGSDNHKPTDVIAQVYAGGLGMPDRDYYLKPDARFKDAREKYIAHVASMFRLAGVSDATAFADAASVVRMETRFAEASLDNVALRDPAATDHKMSFGELQRLAPSFNWAAYYKAAG